MGHADLLEPGEWTEGSYEGDTVGESDTARAVALEALRGSAAPVEIRSARGLGHHFGEYIRGGVGPQRDLMALRLCPVCDNDDELQRLRDDLAALTSNARAWVSTGCVAMYSYSAVDVGLLAAVMADIPAGTMLTIAGGEALREVRFRGSAPERHAAPIQPGSPHSAEDLCGFRHENAVKVFTRNPTATKNTGTPAGDNADAGSAGASRTWNFDRDGSGSSDVNGVTILRENRVLCEVLHRLAELALPDWYLGAGCIAQTVWNLAAGNAPNTGILDYDVVYFDPDTAEEKERAAADRAARQMADLDIRLDVKNQARVHLWYARHFGYDVVPYRSCADAIDTWPTTATAVGIRAVQDGWSVYAPFTMRDLLQNVVRPNRVQITREIYRAKVERWLRVWPFLTVLPWEQGVGTERLRWVSSPAP